MNGSVTPKVSRRSWSLGNGPFAMSSSTWFCQKQRASAHTEDGERDDQARAKLIEVLDEGQAVLVPHPLRRAIEGPP